MCLKATFRLGLVNPVYGWMRIDVVRLMAHPGKEAEQLEITCMTGEKASIID
jgi:hypothetical protein